MKTKKQKVLLIISISGILLLLGVTLAFVYRNSLLDNIIHRIDTKLQQEYQCRFTVKKAVFQGLSNIEFQHIALVPNQADTLVRIDKLKTSINIWKLIVGDIQLGKLEINKGYIQLVKTKNGSNFQAFLRSKKEKNDDSKINYASLLNRISSKAMDLIPTDMNVKGFKIKIDDLGDKVIFDFNQLALANKNLDTQIHVTSNNFSQLWTLKGFADPRNRKAKLTFAGTQNDTIKIPFLDKKFNLKTGFQSIHFNMDNLAMNNGELHIDGYSSIENLIINHPKIARKDVVIKKARFDYHWIIGKRFITLDSTSTAQLNLIKCRPYISYSNEDNKIYTLNLKILKIKAQDFISSLPTGLFSHFEGMEAQGNFSYALNFEYDSHKPNNVIFESKLKPESLKITKYGEADLNKLNGNFVYRAIDKGVPQRPILVGSANPYFMSLPEISPYLQKSVLTSEDPSFFNHRGFINEAFKQSIVKNIRTKKFARGASTISMQLVKNVFLTREKTLSRKLEEILLVYILENQRIASKERMLEVYFNIIEWGPNVYGIGEASRFYFQKSPSELTLNECLFLSTIIPKPKGFMYRFDAEHQLKTFAKQQNDFLTKLMLRRKILTENDTIDQHLGITISGAARSFLKQKPTSTIEIDSTSIEEFDF